MKSGLEGRNNSARRDPSRQVMLVSMKSGLEGRNNFVPEHMLPLLGGLNEVRPRRPEQCGPHRGPRPRPDAVSMKSGLEGRNNAVSRCSMSLRLGSLNEVRPRRPEQSRTLNE